LFYFIKFITSRMARRFFCAKGLRRHRDELTQASVRLKCHRHERRGGGRNRWFRRS
jgi:hypothetical protein